MFKLYVLQVPIVYNIHDYRAKNDWLFFFSFIFYFRYECTVPAYNILCVGTVPAFNVLCIGTVPAYNDLCVGTVPAYKHNLKIYYLS
jgi:hypothetical protein